MKNPYEVIKLDRYTKKIQLPDLLLTNRSFDIVGKIPKYTNWNTSLVGNGLDEISFDVHKYNDGVLCPVWDEIVDLKMIDVREFGTFEIQADYTDKEETIKSVHGVSIETELGQITLNEFHINDEEETTYENYAPTVFCNKNDPKHSLLHRVLADKAPHWQIGHVPNFIILEDKKTEPVDSFQRTYTCDGEDIYSFLTDTVAKESNVVFIFSVKNKQRTIDCYNLSEYVDEDGNVIGDCIGEDTTILVSKRKLANEITINSNKDNVKNCFRIEGGDDVITDTVRAVNMNGSNYIYQFADFQLNDMPKELVDKIKSYNKDMESQRDIYYGENGIYTRLCKKYDELLEYESSMMPDVSIEETDAETEYWKMVDELTSMTVGVSSVNNYNNDLFVGVTNNIEAMAQTLVDARYKVEVIDGTTSYNSSTKRWTGNIKVSRVTDETDYFPKYTKDINKYFTVGIDDDELIFAKQKIQKALAKGSMLDIDFDIAEMTNQQISDYFNLYSLTRLKSFYDGYNSCLSILTTLNQSTTSDVSNQVYNTYYNRLKIVENVYNKRQEQVDKIKFEISEIENEQQNFQDKWNFQKYLGDDLYKIFCSYRREDTYKNDNYISDGYSTAECLARAKELVDAASAEIKKSCVLQRTVSCSLNNLFALQEFEPLYDKFALFNYIRIRTEDEILKLRLMQVDFNGDSVENIDVTFAEQIESVDGKISDLQSIIQQASSIASSYSSTALQAKQGSHANSLVSEIYNKGLNTAKTMLANNDNNEVTITSAGILCRRMDDEGYYGEKQLRITGNIMAFTGDNWESVKMAIGETSFYNPYTEQYENQYGVLAHAIVGKFIVGENAYIGNSDGSVQITGNGIIINDSSNDKVFSVDNNGDAYFKGRIEANEGYFQGAINGGYLYITDERENKMGTSTSVEINPNGTNFNGHNDGFVFNVSKDNSPIMGVTNEGNGYFKGTIDAEDGHFRGAIDGGYLRIAKNDGYSVTIDPYNYLQSDNVFEIDNPDGKKIMGITEDGDGYFTGRITGSYGEFTEGFLVSVTTSESNSLRTYGSIKLDNEALHISRERENLRTGDIEYISDLFIGDDIKFKSSGDINMSAGNSFEVAIGRGDAFSIKSDSVLIAQRELFLTSGTISTDEDKTLICDNGSNLWIGAKQLSGQKFYDGGIALACTGGISFYPNSSSANNIYLTLNEGLRMTGQIGLYSNTMNKHIARYYVSGSNGCSAFGNGGYDTRLYGKNVYLNGTSTAVTSDRRLKKDFADFDDRYERFFMSLKPQSFRYLSNDSNRLHMGFVAQEVKEALDSANISTQEFAGYIEDEVDTEYQEEQYGKVLFDDKQLWLRYEEFIALNTWMIQKLVNKVVSLEEEIHRLKGEN